MPRNLTTNERNVLAHVIIDPDAWWAHANTIAKIDHDDALASKVARWQASYDASVSAGGHIPRAQRTDASPATGAVDQIPPDPEP